jgi:hypothetical protein
MKTEKRTMVVQIRVTDAELADLRERSTRPAIGRWMREVCLGTSKPAPKTTAKVVDMRVLRVLAGIGNNLNQLTRRANREGIGDGEALLLALRRLEKLIGQVAAADDR